MASLPPVAHDMLFCKYAVMKSPPQPCEPLASRDCEGAESIHDQGALVGPMEGLACSAASTPAEAPAATAEAEVADSWEDL